jgi:hypothetical protein
VSQRTLARQVGRAASSARISPSKAIKERRLLGSSPHSLCSVLGSVAVSALAGALLARLGTFVVFKRRRWVPSSEDEWFAAIVLGLYQWASTLPIRSGARRRV